MFGKIIDGTLIKAPLTIEHEGKVHYHPADELYIKKGYLQIKETPCPDDGNFYTKTYVEKDGEIVEVWHKEEIAEDCISEVGE